MVVSGAGDAALVLERVLTEDDSDMEVRRALPPRACGPSCMLRPQAWFLIAECYCAAGERSTARDYVLRAVEVRVCVCARARNPRRDAQRSRW